MQDEHPKASVCIGPRARDDEESAKTIHAVLSIRTDGRQHVAPDWDVMLINHATSLALAMTVMLYDALTDTSLQSGVMAMAPHRDMHSMKMNDVGRSSSSTRNRSPISRPAKLTFLYHFMRHPCFVQPL